MEGVASAKKKGEEVKSKRKREEGVGLVCWNGEAPQFFYCLTSQLVCPRKRKEEKKQERD